MAPKLFLEASKPSLRTFSESSAAFTPGTKVTAPKINAPAVRAQVNKLILRISIFSDLEVFCCGAKTLGCQPGVPAPLSGEFAESLSKDHFFSGTMPGTGGYSDAM